MIIREYKEKDELAWIQCRVLAFLDTAYFDDVYNKKEVYDDNSVELIAEVDGRIVGLIDVQYETEEKTVCTKGNGLGGMIWHIAVLKEFRKQGIAKQLLEKSLSYLKVKNISYLEAWTRDDEFVLNWYKQSGFVKGESYYHVFMDGNEIGRVTDSKIDKMYLSTASAHYLGDDIESLRNKFCRIHECSMFWKGI